MVITFRHIKALFRLIRWPNLIIIAVTQIFIRQFIMLPVLQYGFMEPQLSAGLFSVLVLATVCIGAGGYAINDYFDRKIDRINKPESQIVGRMISLRHAMAYHLVFTITGIILGTYVAYKSQQLFLSIVFLIVSGLLWFYSTTYKRELILGNVIVALLTALVPFIVVLFELTLLANEYGSDFQNISKYLMIWVFGFSLFAFLLNLIREIIKDVKDFDGDQAYGKKTIPVIWGITSAKWIVSVLIIITAALIVLSWWFFIPDLISLTYFVVLFIIPLVFVMVLVIGNINRKAWKQADILVKCIMLAGLGYMLAVPLIMRQLV